jgi:repressor LexA
VTLAKKGTNISTMTNIPTDASTSAKRLTQRQQDILDFIRGRCAQQGSPSLWEIAAAFGMRQTGGVRKHLQVLESKGCLHVLSGTARGIRVLEPLPSARQAKQKNPQPSLLFLPILGRVAAGVPISAQLDLDAPSIAFERLLFAPRPDYLLRVQGDSMRDEGILDGDLIAVQQRSTAENGQIVVARINAEITVKRFQRNAQGIQLLPRNPDFAPIIVPAEADFAIEGVYCGLLRRA